MRDLPRLIRGGVFLPMGPGYDDHREVFNRSATAQPAAIAMCADAKDVAIAMHAAASEGVRVAARAGGHSIGGHCLVDGGVVLDLRALNQLSVDVTARTLTVGAGCLWAEVLGRLVMALGLPGPFDPRVGMSGLTLGGGYGMLSRLHGLACDNLLGAEVVFADGTTGEADESLLWGLRGAGSHLAIATSLRFQLHPLQKLSVARVAWPLSRLRDALDFYASHTASLEDASTVYLGIGEQVELQAFSFGRQALPAFPAGATVQVRATSTYAAAHVENFETFPPNHHHRWRSHLLPALTPAVLDLLASGSHPGWLVLEHLGGAIGRIPSDATAFPHRGAKYGIVSALKWSGEAKASDLARQDALHQALRPHALGTYANYLSESDAVAAYGANLPKLRALKQQLDPNGLLRLLD